jgi:hypothetical protein
MSAATRRRTLLKPKVCASSFPDLLCIWLGVLLIASSQSRVEARKLLFFGDSVLRNIMNDWCQDLHEHDNVTSTADWGRIELKYGASNLKLHSPGRCVQGEDSIAQVHLFGSNMKGPYFYDEWEKESSPQEIRDTDWRIEHGLNGYIRHFGLPDKIFMTTCNWDHAGQGFFKTPMTIDLFKTNTLFLLDYIRRLLPSNATVDKVEIGLVTCPLDYTLHEQIIDFNEYYRNLSASNHVTLYDYDADVWSVANYQMTLPNQLFLYGGHKHDIHPDNQFMVAAARKLLGREFSTYYYDHGDRVKPTVSSIPQDVIVRLIRCQPSNRIYFLDTLESGVGSQRTRTLRKITAGSVDELLMRVLHVSSSHAMTVTQGACDALPLVELKGRIDGDKVGLLTRDGRAYMLFRDKLLKLKDFIMLRLLLPENSIIRDFPDPFLDGIALAITIDEYPPIFEEGRLIKSTNDRQVYVVRNFRRLPIANVRVFFANGWDFDNVTTVHDLVADTFFPLLPLGPELS